MRLAIPVAVKRMIILGLMALLISSCTPSDYSRPPAYELVGQWIDLTLHILQYTPANSPTFAARSLGYIGLTMYESCVPGLPSHLSMARALQGLDSLPLPETSQSYDWALSLNAGQAEILRLVYQQTSDENKYKIDSLEARLMHSLLLSDEQQVQRSVTFGREIARAIYQWSTTDGGHRGYLKNFDKTLVLPTHPGAWQPPWFAQSFSHFPLHPHWGQNRTFVAENSRLPLPVMITYDTTPGSLYHQQFMAVYEQEKNLTIEQKQAAIWWSDDPDDTCTPPGHSYYLAGLVLKQKRPDLITCAETMARLGLALADAFTNCWKWKYHFFSERPNTFITRFIDPEWESFWPDPPFPAFPSGHAIQAGAAATIMEQLYGPDITLTDSLHLRRVRDRLRQVDFVPRSFTSFWQIAQETANSRFYGGIHTPQDNDVGLAQGKIIASNVNKLPWRRD